MKKITKKILTLAIMSFMLLTCFSVTTNAYSANYNKTYKAVNMAKKQLGVKYKLANNATNPKVGYLDCSGLMIYSWKSAGISLPRTANAQRHYNKGVYYTNYYGKKASTITSKLKVGDLLFYQTDKDKAIDHVGMYIGGGKMIHASSLKGKVVTESLSAYLKNPKVLSLTGWRRLLPY